MPVYFPPLPGTANDGSTIIAAQMFERKPDLSQLALSGVQNFLGLSSSPGSASPDDADVILATQFFGA